MTTSATVLDLIEAFRSSKTMLAAAEPGIFDGTRPADDNEPARLLKKQQEYLNTPKPGGRDRNTQATSGAVLNLIEAFRRSKTMFAAAQTRYFRWPTSGRLQRTCPPARKAAA